MLYRDKLYQGLFDNKLVTVDKETFFNALDKDKNYRQRLYQGLNDKKLVTVDYNIFEKSLNITPSYEVDELADEPSPYELPTNDTELSIDPVRDEFDNFVMTDTKTSLSQQPETEKYDNKDISLISKELERFNYRPDEVENIFKKISTKNTDKMKADEKYLATTGKKEYEEFRKNESFFGSLTDTDEKIFVDDLLKKSKRELLKEENQEELKSTENYLSKLRTSDKIPKAEKEALEKELQSQKEYLQTRQNRLSNITKNKEEFKTIAKTVLFPPQSLMDKMGTEEKLTKEELDYLIKYKDYSDLLPTLTTQELKELGFERKEFLDRVKELSTNFDELITLIPSIKTLIYTIPKKLYDVQRVKTAIERQSQMSSEDDYYKARQEKVIKTKEILNRSKNILNQMKPGIPNYNLEKELENNYEQFTENNTAVLSYEQFKNLLKNNQEKDFLNKIESAEKDFQQKDKKIIDEYIDEMIETQLLKTTIGYDVADVLASMPSFIKTLGAGRNIQQLITKKITEKTAKDVPLKIGEKLIKAGLTSALAIPFQIPDILEQTAARNYRDIEFVVDPKTKNLQMKFNITNEKQFNNLVVSTLNQTIENLSEQFGEFLFVPKKIKNVANKIRKSNPKIAKIFDKLAIDPKFKKFLRDRNIHGIPEEYFEETFGDVLRVIAGIDERNEDENFYNAMYNALFPSYRESATRLLAFSAMPAAGIVYSQAKRPLDNLKSKRKIDDYLKTEVKNLNFTNLEDVASYANIILSAQNPDIPQQTKKYLLNKLEKDYNEKRNTADQEIKEQLPEFEVFIIKTPVAEVKDDIQAGEPVKEIKPESKEEVKPVQPVEPTKTKFQTGTVTKALIKDLDSGEENIKKIKIGKYDKDIDGYEVKIKGKATQYLTEKELTEAIEGVKKPTEEVEPIKVEEPKPPVVDEVKVTDDIKTEPVSEVKEEVKPAKVEPVKVETPKDKWSIGERLKIKRTHKDKPENYIIKTLSEDINEKITLTNEETKKDIYLTKEQLEKRIVETEKEKITREVIKDETAKDVSGKTGVYVKTEAGVDKTKEKTAPGTISEKRIKPKRTKEIPVGEIILDPKRFQFRTEVNEKGVTEKLKDADDWDYSKGKGIVVFQDKDGKYYAADGHHRVELAQRLVKQGKTDPEFIDAYVLKETDGWTVKGARIYAMENNIAAGTAEITDIAKYFKDTGYTKEEAKKFNLSLSDKKIIKGFHLGQLIDNIFEKYIKGEIPQNYAVAIGKQLPDKPDIQQFALDYINKGTIKLNTSIEEFNSRLRAINMHGDIITASDKQQELFKEDSDLQKRIKSSMEVAVFEDKLIKKVKEKLGSKVILIKSLKKLTSDKATQFREELGLTELKTEKDTDKLKIEMESFIKDILKKWENVPAIKDIINQIVDNKKSETLEASKWKVDNEDINYIVKNYGKIAEAVFKGKETADIEVEDVAAKKQQPIFKYTDKTTGKLTADTLKTALSEDMKNYGGDIVIVDKQTELPEAITKMAKDNLIAGVYHDNKIYLVAENLKNIGEARNVALQHELVHKGWKGLLDEVDKDPDLKKEYEAIKKQYEALKKLNPKEAEYETFEEYVAYKSDSKHPLWDKIINFFRKLFRKFNKNLLFSKAEIRETLNKVAVKKATVKPTETVKDTKYMFAGEKSLENLPAEEKKIAIKNFNVAKQMQQELESEKKLLEEAQKYKTADEFIKSQFDKEKKYGMQHRPTITEATADNITQEVSDMGLPKDFYDKPNNYENLRDKSTKQSFEVLKRIKGNPETEVTIYQASPKKELNTGDWVTLSKEYAKGEALTEGVKVHEFKVKAKDIQFAGDSINEFGYYPKSTLKEIWEKAQTDKPKFMKKPKTTAEILKEKYAKIKDKQKKKQAVKTEIIKKQTAKTEQKKLTFTETTDKVKNIIKGLNKSEGYKTVENEIRKLERQRDNLKGEARAKITNKIKPLRTKMTEEINKVLKDYKFKKEPLSEKNLSKAVKQNILNYAEDKIPANTNVKFNDDILPFYKFFNMIRDTKDIRQLTKAVRTINTLINEQEKSNVEVEKVYRVNNKEAITMNEADKEIALTRNFFTDRLKILNNSIGNTLNNSTDLGEQSIQLKAIKKEISDFIKSDKAVSPSEKRLLLNKVSAIHSFDLLKPKGTLKNIVDRLNEKNKSKTIKEMKKTFKKYKDPQDKIKIFKNPLTNERFDNLKWIEKFDNFINAYDPVKMTDLKREKTNNLKLTLDRVKEIENSLSELEKDTQTKILNQISKIKNKLTDTNLEDITKGRLNDIFKGLEKLKTDLPEEKLKQITDTLLKKVGNVIKHNDELIELLKFEETKLETNEIMSLYEELNKVKSELYKEELEAFKSILDLSPKEIEDLKRIDKKPLKDLSLEELEVLKNTINFLEKALKSNNLAIKDERGKFIENLEKVVLDDIGSIAGENVTGLVSEMDGIRNLFKNIFEKAKEKKFLIDDYILSTMLPRIIINERYIGKTLSNLMMKRLIDGNRKMLAIKHKYNDDFHDIIKRTKMKDRDIGIRNILVEFDFGVKGKVTHKLSENDLLGIYVNSFNPYNKTHLIYGGGKIKEKTAIDSHIKFSELSTIFQELKENKHNLEKQYKAGEISKDKYEKEKAIIDYKLENRDEVTKQQIELAEKNIENIQDLVKSKYPVIREFAEGVWEHFEKYHNDIAEVFEAINGYKLPKQPFYVPIQVFGEDLSNIQQMNKVIEEMMKFSNYTKAGVNFGNLIKRVGAKNPINLDIWSINSNYTRDSSRYIGFAEIVSDVNKIVYNPAFKKALENKYGKKGAKIYKYINNHYKSMVAGLDMNMDWGIKLSRKLRGNLATAVLSFYNVITPFKQTLSAFPALYYQSPTTFLKSFGRVMSFMVRENDSKFVKDMLEIEPDKIKSIGEFWSAVSPVIRERLERRTMWLEFYEKSLRQGDSILNRYFGKTGWKDKLMFLVTMFDKITVLTTAETMKEEVLNFYQKELGYNFNNPRQFKIAMDNAILIAEDVVSRTQPMGDPMNLAAYQKSGSEFFNWVAIFTNSLNKVLNVGYEEANRMRNKDIDKSKLLADLKSEEVTLDLDIFKNLKTDSKGISLLRTAVLFAAFAVVENIISNAFRMPDEPEEVVINALETGARMFPGVSAVMEGRTFLDTVIKPTHKAWKDIKSIEDMGDVFDVSQHIFLYGSQLAGFNIKGMNNLRKALIQTKDFYQGKIPEFEWRAFLRNADTLDRYYPSKQKRLENEWNKEARSLDKETLRSLPQEEAQNKNKMKQANKELQKVNKRIKEIEEKMREEISEGDRNNLRDNWEQLNYWRRELVNSYMNYKSSKNSNFEMPRKR